MNDLAAGERLGRKFTCVPFIPHGRGLNRGAFPIFQSLFYPQYWLGDDINHQEYDETNHTWTMTKMPEDPEFEDEKALL